jgi:hypothetical protein
VRTDAGRRYRPATKFPGMTPFLKRLFVELILNQSVPLNLHARLGGVMIICILRNPVYCSSRAISEGEQYREEQPQKTPLKKVFIFSRGSVIKYTR